MNVYRFKEGETKPCESLIGISEQPEGFVVFSEGTEEIDWTQKQCIDGKLVDIPSPEQPAPEQLAPYVPTTEELLKQEKNAKQWEIKAKLQATDYVCLKLVDGAITAEEYEPVKTERASLREAYNKIEAATTIEEVSYITET